LGFEIGKPKGGNFWENWKGGEKKKKKKAHSRGMWEEGGPIVTSAQ